MNEIVRLSTRCRLCLIASHQRLFCCRSAYEVEARLIQGFGEAHNDAMEESVWASLPAHSVPHGTSRSYIDSQVSAVNRLRKRIAHFEPWDCWPGRHSHGHAGLFLTGVTGSAHIRSAHFEGCSGASGQTLKKRVSRVGGRQLLGEATSE